MMNLKYYWNKIWFYFFPNISTENFNQLYSERTNEQDKINNLKQLEKACEKGDIDVVKKLLKKSFPEREGIGNYLNWGLHCACSKKQMEIVKLMIAEGASFFRFAMITACDEGSLDVVKFLVEKGFCEWNVGLYEACKSGNLKIGEYMIEKGANDWNLGLDVACVFGHKEIVELMIEKGARNLNSGMGFACEFGHREIVEFIIEKVCSLRCNRVVETLVESDWNYGMVRACEGGHIEIVKFMIEKGRSSILNPVTEWNVGMRNACRREHTDIVKLMIENGANDWNFGLVRACAGRNKKLAELMIKKGANNFNSCLEELSFLYDLDDIIPLLIENGATNWTNQDDEWVCKKNGKWISQLSFPRLEKFVVLPIFSDKNRKKLKQRLYLFFLIKSFKNGNTFPVLKNSTIK